MAHEGWGRRYYRAGVFDPDAVILGRGESLRQGGAADFARCALGRFATIRDPALAGPLQISPPVKADGCLGISILQMDRGDHPAAHSYPMIA